MSRPIVTTTNSTSTNGTAAPLGLGVATTLAATGLVAWMLTKVVKNTSKHSKKVKGELVTMVDAEVIIATNRANAARAINKDDIKEVVDEEKKEPEIAIVKPFRYTLHPMIPHVPSISNRFWLPLLIFFMQLTLRAH
jgi:hypothetical protein